MIIRRSRLPSIWVICPTLAVLEATQIAIEVELNRGGLGLRTRLWKIVLR